jgi:hypothetical protein
MKARASSLYVPDIIPTYANAFLFRGNHKDVIVTGFCPITVLRSGSSKVVPGFDYLFGLSLSWNPCVLFFSLVPIVLVCCRDTWEGSTCLVHFG